MKANTPQFFLAMLFATFCVCAPARGETVGDLLDRFDTDGDRQLSADEFAKALKAAGIRTVTPAGVERAAAARTTINKRLQTHFSQSEPRYEARREQAEAILRQKKYDRVITPGGPLLLDPSILVEGLDLSTYDRFIVNRAVLDQRLRQRASSAEVQDTKPVGMDAFVSFLENNFRIRDDMANINDDAGKDDPAKFSWTKPKGEDSYYAVDAAILYTPTWLDWNWSKTKEVFKEGGTTTQQGWVRAGRALPSFEAHVSTQDGANRNLLAYSLPLHGRMKWFPGPSAVPGDEPFFTGHDFAFMPTYVTDRVDSIRTWGVDAKYQPSVARLNLNHDNPRPIPAVSWLEWSFSGGIGASFRSIDQGTVAMTSDNYGVFTGLVGAKLVLFKKLTLSGDFSTASTLWGDVDSHSLLIVSAELLLDERNHFTVGASYVNGEEEPTFEKVDSITGWVGVKF